MKVVPLFKSRPELFNLDPINKEILIVRLNYVMDLLLEYDNLKEVDNIMSDIVCTLNKLGEKL